MWNNLKAGRFFISLFILFATSLFFLLSSWPAVQFGEMLSLFPPLMAVLLVLISQNVYLGLGGAVLIGASVKVNLAFPAQDISFLKSSWHFYTNSLQDSWNLQILAFIPLMMICAHLIIMQGGIQQILNALGKWAKGRKMTQLATIASGTILFFDDYANTMMVGPAMRPLAEKNGISPQKLAFLVDATSAPISGVAVVSTWIGHELGLFRQLSQSLSLNLDEFNMFLDALPFRFYCIMMLMFTLVITFLNRDFGSMLTAEKNYLREHHQKKASLVKKEEEEKPQSLFIAFLSSFFPLMMIFLSLLFGLWLDGSGADLLASSTQFWFFTLFSLEHWKDVLVASDNSITVLLISSLIGFFLTVMSCLFLTKIKRKEVVLGILSAIKGSLFPLIILSFSWALKAVCDDLQTGSYIATLLSGVISPFWYTTFVFLISAAISFCIGTSWGTMAILLPTAIPLAYSLDANSYGIITMVSLAAVLDGSIFGDHCSPLSDTTIMSSISTNCDPLEHVKTQLPYGLFVGITSILFGHLWVLSGGSIFYSYLFSLLFMISFVFLVGRNPEKRVRKEREEEEDRLVNLANKTT